MMQGLVIAGAAVQRPAVHHQPRRECPLLVPARKSARGATTSSPAVCGQLGSYQGLSQSALVRGPGALRPNWWSACVLRSRTRLSRRRCRPEQLEAFVSTITAYSDRSRADRDHLPSVDDLAAPNSFHLAGGGAAQVGLARGQADEDRKRFGDRRRGRGRVHRGQAQREGRGRARLADREDRATVSGNSGLLGRGLGAGRPDQEGDRGEPADTQQRLEPISPQRCHAITINNTTTPFPAPSAPVESESDFRRTTS